jgi:tetratricopeptide (TPR) repeat protein
MNLLALPDLGFNALASVAGTTALLILVYFLFLYRKEEQLADYKTKKINLEGKSRRWIEKKAQELTRVEAYRLAGDLRAHLKQWEEAAELYQRGGNFLRAAESYLALGRTGEAARMFLARQDYARAAELFLENGDFSPAASAYLAGGDPIKAAETFAQGGAVDEAARLYLEQGLYRKAMEVFRQKERWAQAAEALWRSFEEERARLPEEVSLNDSMPLRMMARQAGEWYQQAGQQEAALEAYQNGGWVRESADTLAALERFDEAARAYLEAGELLRAADCYDSAGQAPAAARLRAQYHLRQGQERAAARFLVGGGGV